MPSIPPAITIAICTFNRWLDLSLVLQDLAAQVTDQTTEVLIIDNCSSDMTPQMLRDYHGHLRLRSVRETRQGTVYARNRALQEAAGEYLIFLDDDIRLHDNWYQGYVKELLGARRIAVAGAVHSTWPTRVPRWIGDTTNPPFPGVTVHYLPWQAARTIDLDDPMPFTANLGVRLDLAREIGFREDLGHVRGKPMGGDDMDFCRRFIASHGAFWYDPGISVDHPVVPQRMSLSHTFGYLFRGAMAESWYAPPPPGGKRLGPIPIWSISKMIGSAGSAVAGIFTANPRRIMCGLGDCVRVAGLWWGLLHQPSSRI